MVALTWQDAVFFACDVAFFADLILYAKAPEKPHPPWRSRLNAVLLIACALTGWTLSLRAWAVLTLASAATWALIGRRNAARIAAKKTAAKPGEKSGGKSVQIAAETAGAEPTPRAAGGSP